MRVNLLILALFTVVFVVVAALALSLLPASAPGATLASPSPAIVGTPFRLGIVPERDVFAQRRRYRALADVLEIALGRPVKLVTGASYQHVLDDFAAGTIDGAFLGSLAARLAMVRHDGRVLVRPVLADGTSNYRGVLFTRADSPVRSWADLGDRSVAIVRMTTAGELFVRAELADRGPPAGGPLRLRAEGTHDAVIHEVLAGRADAGAAKSPRLEEAERRRPGAVRRLAASVEVPNNALVVGPGVDAETSDGLTRALLTMNATPDGRTTLAVFGARSFVPCAVSDYAGVDELVRRLPHGWDDLPAPADAGSGRVPGL